MKENRKIQKWANRQLWSRMQSGNQVWWHLHSGHVTCLVKQLVNLIEEADGRWSIIQTWDTCCQLYSTSGDDCRHRQAGGAPVSPINRLTGVPQGGKHRSRQMYALWWLPRLPMLNLYPVIVVSGNNESCNVSRCHVEINPSLTHLLFYPIQLCQTNRDCL